MPNSNLNHASSKDAPIDVVIAWVDGNDPAHQQKISAFIDTENQASKPGAHKTRFGNVNELKYCILSILTFAPFVRKIFIVSDNQTPPVFDDVKPYFPNRVKDIQLINHEEIFNGFEEFLPVFNSRSIETMIWRIKDLADNFVYFNDDTFLVRPINPEDWFRNGRPVIRGKWMPSAEVRLFWDNLKSNFQKKVLGKNNYEPRASYHTGQWNAAKLLGFRWKYFVLDHTAHAIHKQTALEFSRKKSGLIKKNISFKFRHYSQFNFLSLTYHLEILSGNSNISSPNLAYLQPLGRPENYIDKKINLCESNSNIIYMCVQSLDLCPESDTYKVFGWLEKIMSLKNKS